MSLIVCSTHFDNGNSAALASDPSVMINPLHANESVSIPAVIRS
jgi:hypothetical protein